MIRCLYLCPPGQGDGQGTQGRKAVVFISSCDGVELHYELLVKVRRGGGDAS